MSHYLLYLGGSILMLQLLFVQVSYSIPSFLSGSTAERLFEKPLFSAVFPAPALLTEAPSQYQSIVFTGDMMLARNVEYLMETESPQYPFAALPLKKYFPNAAIVTNFEASIPKIHVETPPYHMRFSVEEGLLSVPATEGITHASLANNHSSDHGHEGYSNTIAALEGNNITPFGHYSEVTNDSVAFISLYDVTVSIIALHAVSEYPSLSDLEAVFKFMNVRSDVQLVYIHWGEEYKTLHRANDEKLAKSLVALGADAIIGHHPHVTQDIQLINGVPIFYSLGNFIFDQYFSQAVQEGYLLQLIIDGSDLGFEIIPISSVGTLSQPAVMHPKDYERFLSALATQSDSVLQTHILSGFIPLSLLVATSSKMAIINE